MLNANQLANEAERHKVGVKISSIPIDRLRISAVTDASWGMLKMEKFMKVAGISGQRLLSIGYDIICVLGGPFFIQV